MHWSTRSGSSRTVASRVFSALKAGSTTTIRFPLIIGFGLHLQLLFHYPVTPARQARGRLRLPLTAESACPTKQHSRNQKAGRRGCAKRPARGSAAGQGARPTKSSSTQGTQGANTAGQGAGLP